MGDETRCVRIQLKPNSLERVREWATTLNTVRRDEALATLRDETVVLEAAFLDQTAEGDCLIYVMKAESFEKAKEAAAASVHDIDRYHKAFKRDTWGIRKDLELLLDLDLIEERGSRRPHPGEYRSAHSWEAEGGEDVMTFGRTTPSLRILDEAKARELYVEFLGFTVDWEHRFEPDTPLYMQVSKDQCVLHLSEHYGDGTPGVAVRIDTSDIDAFHRELANKRYKYARPGIQDQPWGTREVSVTDPFGNRLTFTMQSAPEVGT